MNKIKAFGITVYKKEKNTTSLLLCKSVNSKQKYGFLKGVALHNEIKQQTAIREFEEESGIKVDQTMLKKFFYQENELKDIGIYLVNYDNIKGIDKYFDKNNLKEQYICSENSIVKFFDILDMPHIKTKQLNIKNEIVNFLSV